MKVIWFAGNFCPKNANCSEGEGALIPAVGPRIRIVDYHTPHQKFITGSVYPFLDEQSFKEANTNPVDWLLCDGKVYNDGHQPYLWETITQLYGGEGRSFFKVPLLPPDPTGRGDFYINRSSNIEYPPHG